MTTETPASKSRRSPLHGFEQTVERILGVDMRMLYGMGVPVVGVSVIIALLLGFAASPWTVAALLVIEAIVVAVVLLGFVGLLNEDPDDEPRT